MPTNTVNQVEFAADGLSLSGTLHFPNQPPSAVIIGCHGLMADKNSPKQIDLAGRCTALGMAYFRFDHRGCGDSDGNFETDTTLEGRMADLMAAVGVMGKTLGSLPVGLFGSSLGGTVCLAAAERISPFSIVTLAAPMQSRSIQLPSDSPQSLKNEVRQNQLRFDISSKIASVCNILIVHGSDDETVDVQNAHNIYRLAQDPKRLLILEGGDHRVTDPAHQRHYVQEAVQWFTDCVATS
ncbi:alpha/beta hydrolase [Desulfosarcina ovata]|nr:alpha/beta fold hydrolase [Desulfosarcina ovata]